MAKSLNFNIFYCFLFIYFLLFASSAEGAARGRPFNEGSQAKGDKQVEGAGPLDNQASQTGEENKELGKTEIVVPEVLCEKASQTWSGNCGKTQNCDKQCIAWEGAKHGACHTRKGKHMCFCYFARC